ncbi:MAG: hypothetical protein AAGE52_29235 [Myxococcota bacterium]
MLRFVFYGCLVLAGCGTTVSSMPDGGPDAGPPPTNMLEVEGDPSVTLVFGAEASIRVRYLDSGRSPIVNERVEFVFEGRAHDSSLGSLDAITDDTGLATTTIVAGTTPAAFRVRVTAENADAVFLDVAVSDEGFGQLAAEVSHDGTREVAALGVAVFAGLTCDDEATRTERGDRFRLQTEEDEAVTFLGLPAGLEYAVAARGEGPEGDLLAWGCVDGVAIEAELAQEVEVVALDLAQQIEGSYQGSLAFTADTTAQLIGDAFAAVELEAGSGLILDAAVSDLRAAGDMERAARITELRTVGGIDALLDAMLVAEDVGPSVGVSAAEETLRASVTDLAVLGSLRLGDEMSFQVSHLTAGVGDAAVEVDADAMEIESEVIGEVDERGEMLDLERMTLQLSASDVVVGFAAAISDADPEEALGAWLGDLAGCGAVPELADIVTECDGDCLANACEDVMENVAGTLLERLSEVDMARGRMELRGDIELSDEGSDLTVDRLDALLDGVWTGERSPMPEMLDVTLEGTRIVPPT